MALKIQWIPRIIGNENWNYIYDFLIPSLGEYTWVVNINAGDINKMIVEDSFWKEVWVSWSKCYYAFDVEDIGNQFIWGNSHIRDGGLPIINEYAIRGGLLQVKQLLNGKAFKSHGEIISDFGNRCCNWLEYKMVKHSIPINWVNHFINGTKRETKVSQPTLTIEEL